MQKDASTTFKVCRSHCPIDQGKATIQWLRHRAWLRPCTSPLLLCLPQEAPINNLKLSPKGGLVPSRFLVAVLPHLSLCGSGSKISPSATSRISDHQRLPNRKPIESLLPPSAGLCPEAAIIFTMYFCGKDSSRGSNRAKHSQTPAPLGIGLAPTSYPLHVAGEGK